MGSATGKLFGGKVGIGISTHALRGERDRPISSRKTRDGISTHALRGERDVLRLQNIDDDIQFQPTRSVGSATATVSRFAHRYRISTHALRGERDYDMFAQLVNSDVISTHALRGERDGMLPLHQ